MAQQLQDMAGGNAVIRVDSFEGGRLPPKSTITAIHITRDAFAAENHFAGGLFIDIITQPGIGPLRTNMSSRLRDDSMSGRPPAAFADQSKKGPERTQSYNGGIGGSLIKQKASFSLSLNGSRLRAGHPFPANRYLLADNLQMQRNTRFSAGVSRALTKMLSINATYAHTRGANLMRGQNLNAPVNGVRPDPAFVNVVEVLGDARSESNTLNIGSSINFNAGGPSGPMMMGGGGMVMIMNGGPAPGGSVANKRWNSRRMSIFTNLSLGRTLNNTDGPFSMPASGRIEDDWGPANFDVRRRFNVSLSSSQLRNLNANLSLNASSASPYMIRTGVDTNGDLVFTDRPAGVGRNSARGSGQWTLSRPPSRAPARSISAWGSLSELANG